MAIFALQTSFWHLVLQVHLNKRPSETRIRFEVCDVRVMITLEMVNMRSSNADTVTKEEEEKEKSMMMKVKTGIRSIQTGRDNGGNKNYLRVLHQLPGLLNTGNLFYGAWGGVVVKALRYWSDGPGIDPRWCHLGFFPWFLPTKPCALRSTQPLKMSTRDFSWGKGGRCVWLTTYYPCSAESREDPGP